jgi:hypothetical protein
MQGIYSAERQEHKLISRISARQAAYSSQHLVQRYLRELFPACEQRSASRQRWLQ